MFAPQSYPEILARLVAHVRATTDQLTDFNIGSVTRSWLEAVAVGLDELWLGTTHAIEQAIPEAVYLAFGFERLPAAYALGEVTFYRDAPAPADIQLPAGIRVRAIGGGAEYVTVAPGVIPAGQYEVTVLARAVDPGDAANVGAGLLTVVVESPVEGLSVTNRQPITNGRDEETEVERRARFARYVEALARGTVSALDYAARLAMLTDGTRIVEQVRHVAIVEVPGTVDLYVHNGIGQTSAALVDRVRVIVEGARDEYTGIITPGWRAAGVEVRYHAMTDIPLHVTARLQIAAGYHLAQVREGIERALSSLARTFAGEVLTVPDLMTTIYGVPGVRDLVIEAPTTAIRYRPWERPVYGSLTLR